MRRPRSRSAMAWPCIVGRGLFVVHHPVVGVALEHDARARFHFTSRNGPVPTGCSIERFPGWASITSRATAPDQRRRRTPRAGAAPVREVRTSKA
jgi:hypothetical protein